MKIPKYVRALCARRARLAEELRKTDRELSQWLDRHGVETDDDDTHGGLEMYSNPRGAERRVLAAIEKT